MPASMKAVLVLLYFKSYFIIKNAGGQFSSYDLVCCIWPTYVCKNISICSEKILSYRFVSWSRMFVCFSSMVNPLVTPLPSLLFFCLNLWWNQVILLLIYDSILLIYDSILLIYDSILLIYDSSTVHKSVIVVRQV